METKVNPIRNGWFWCCGSKIQKVTDKTNIIGDIYCRHCKTYHKVIVENGILIGILSPQYKKAL